MGLLDRNFMSAQCPRCTYEMDVQFRAILLEDMVYCPACRSRIRLVDENASAHEAGRQLEGALREMEREINSPNMTITIEL